MGYSFKAQPLSLNGINTSPLSVSMSVTPGANNTPMIGPEIGPDPRNAQCTIKLGDTPGMEGPNGIKYDFIFGFRFLLPAGRKYHILVMDMDTDLPLYESDVDGGGMVVGDRKYYLRYHVTITEDGAVIELRTENIKSVQEAYNVPQDS